MFSVIDSAIFRTRTILMTFVLLIIAGTTTYSNIPKESSPDITIPMIYISIIHDGISPEDAERKLVRPMENELKTIEGIKQMSANASEGHASVTLEFIAGFNSKEALADVRDKVTLAKAKLPSETEEPTINEVTLANSNPAITIFLSGAVSERGLITIARDLQDKLAAMVEVLEVDIAGDREDMVEIIVDPLLMESYGLDQQDIYNLVERNNRLIPAGTMDTGKGRFAIKIPSVFETIEDLLNLPIKVEDDRIITFKDVALVRRSYKDPNSIARLNSQRAIAIEVKKRPGQNIISTVDKVKKLIATQQVFWPKHVQVNYTGDESVNVKNMLNDLQNNVISAVLLVVIVIIASLGMRSASLVGLSIPGSFLTGILVLAVFGLTVNIVVLFALIMAVGLLVDGAIVVTEFADRQMSEGDDRVTAYTLAAKRMAWPIIASTATTLAAFAPLMFWPGTMGEFMKFMPITLIAVLTASLIMALIFVPTMGSLWGASRVISSTEKQNIECAESGALNKMKGFTGRYVSLLSVAILHPVKVLFFTLFFSIVVIVNYINSDLGIEFFPDVEPNGISLIVRSYGDLSIKEKDTIMKEVERRIIDIPAIESLYSRTGGTDLIGRLRINLIDWQSRKPADEIVSQLQQRVANYAGVEVEVRKDSMGPSGGKDLILELSAKQPKLVDDAVHKVRQLLSSNQKFTNIEDGSSKPGIEWQLNVNRALAAVYDADAALVGSTVQMVTNGLKLGEYRPDDVDDELDIRVRFPLEKRNITRIDDLRVQTEEGLIPVTNFVEKKAIQKVDTIRRVDAKRVVTIKANLAPGAQLIKELPWLKTQLLNLDIDWTKVAITVKGQNEDQQESEGFLLYAFLVALFVMGLILVTQFNSFYQAFLILSAVLFSTVGVLLALLLVEQPFGTVMSGMGVIALAGIVVNNNIVLIDTYNVLRKSGLDVQQAILRTGAQRLRPVMLTTITTILGLLPMVFQINIDFIERDITYGAPSTQWWAQLATAIAGGLAFATLLTLLLTPCLLALREFKYIKPVKVKAKQRFIHSKRNTFKPAQSYEEI